MVAEAQRPFRVLGIQQIALGGKDRSRLERLWIELLGLAVVGSYRSERENVDELILEAGHGEAAVEIDLMQPIDEAAKPAVHEPALHHVGLWVDDLVAAVGWLSAEGVRFTPGGVRRGAAGYDVCFIHPRPDPKFPFSGEGVLIELVQAPPHVIARVESAAPSRRASEEPS